MHQDDVREEIFDVVNDHDQVIGSASREEVHARGLKHRAVHVFVFNPAGELFVQKRSATKDTFPGCYDSSASGHLGSGEEYNAYAVRELQEELRLEVSPQLLRKHFKIAACPETGREFAWVYSIQGDFTPTVNPAEIDAGRFFPVSSVRALIAQHRECCAPSFRCVFHEFMERGLFPSVR
jgi:isopentenyl-diphosphate delta-isomerase type 1